MLKTGQRAYRNSPLLWLIPLLLIAAAYGIHGLNQDAFGWDEVSSMNAVGGTNPGLSLMETWENVTGSAPDQAAGFALLLSQWGRVVGWTEFSTRALPFFAGMIAIAWVYRIGRDFFGPQAGLYAAAMLVLSIFFSVFMHQLRVFTLVALVLSLTLWCYWRVMLHPRPPGLAAQAGLLLGGIGLFYTHYFATLFLVALGLYHLLFAPKTRRWWRPVLAMALAGLAFLPAFQVFLGGVSVNTENTQLQAMAIHAPAVLYYLLLSFSNGFVPLLGIIVVGLFVGLRRVTNDPKREGLKASSTTTITRPISFLLFVTVGTLILIVAANEVLQVMTAGRLRYLMPLWPLLALLAGWSIWQLRHIARWLPLVILALWALVPLWTSSQTDFAYAIEPPELPWREMRRALQDLGSPEADVFMFHGVPSRIREFYVASTIPMRREIIETWNSDADFRRYIDPALRVWLGTDWREYEEFGIIWSQEPEYHRFVGLVENEGFVTCGHFIEHPHMHLDLYARSETFCPESEPQMQFGRDIVLSGIDPSVSEERTLRIDMLWQIAPASPADTYSVALHLYAADSETFITAADFGLPRGPAGPVRREIELGEIPAGAYELRIGVYEWQNGTRLNAVDLETDESSDLLLLWTFDLD